MSAHERRQDAALAALGDGDLDALIVSNLTNIRYLTGFVGSNATVVLSPERRVLLTDFRYLTSAAETVRGVEIVPAGRDVVDALAALISDWGCRRVGFESAHVTHARFTTLTMRFEGVDLVPTVDAVETIRRIKDADEIGTIRRACEIADAAFIACADGIFVGRTERQVAWELATIMREGGAEGPSFDIIVASGDRGALPHAVPANEPIVRDSLVTVDLGAVVDGYCSDCTRTFATGPLPDALGEIYEVCRGAQAAAVAAVAPGIRADALDAVARDIITQAGFGEQFGHGLGHGVGLDIHEAPGVRPGSTDVLEPGMTVTIEPGIYVPGLGGCRIEDLCVVTEDGCDSLTPFVRDLVTVDC